MNYELLNQDNTKVCIKCKTPTSYTVNDKCYDCIRIDTALEQAERKVSDLSISDFKNLMVECFGILKQRESETSEEEYRKLTAKPTKENT